MPHRFSESRIDFDELTGLPTMMYFRKYAGAYVRNALSRNRTPYLIYFNLENFRSFNERYGFEEGDKLLSLMAVSIQEAFPGFLLSRFSSDHFLLICECLSLDSSVEQVSDQLRAYGRRANIELKAGVYPLTDANMDMGVACDRAKLACESIAHRHDFSYRIFDEALNWRVERSTYIESHIDQAISDGWIQVYFQPVVRTVTGEVSEFEALARWNDPQYGMLSPATFVEVLERCRLIHKLDARIIDQACAVWAKAKKSGISSVPMSVNLSRLDFELCDTLEMVERSVRKHGIPRQMLHVEITESALNDDSGVLTREMRRFRNAGYQVWLDDFGSGYSSLNTLKDYVFDVVKIDMAFMREFETKPKSRVIIASIINMAKQLGMQTLVEGVETPEQFDYLRAIGCEFVQGYLVGRPVPPQRNFSRVESGELVLANNLLQGYHDRMSGINTLSATPFDFPWESPSEETPLAEMLPLAIIECDAGRVRFISANDAFVSVLRDTEMGTMADVAAELSMPHHSQSRSMRGVIDAAMVSNGIESVDIIAGGRHCVMRVRRVASHGSVTGLLVSIMNLSRFANIGEEKRLQIALRYLYASHDEVDIIDLAEGTISNVYRGNAQFPTLCVDNMAQRSTEQFARQCVHPSDIDRFVRYMNMQTVDERVSARGQSTISDAFRLMGMDGLYFWATILLVPMVVEGDSTVLVCARQSNTEIVSRIEEGDQIPKSILWDTLLELVPAGVFWKGLDRRFVGVNRNFLDFYEFDSINDVLGKTDEDMGWHVENDPFKNNEIRVLEKGEPVLNSHGRCISKGEVHDILASKIPLRENGEVIGLLGYFIDQPSPGSHSSLLDGFDRMAKTDTLTGIPNMRGLDASIEAYGDASRTTGIDFVCVVVDILGIHDLNDVYGHAFGDSTLKVIAQRLYKTFGVNGVVARVGGDKFAILRYLSDEDDVQALEEQVDKVVESITEVDGIAIHLHGFVGSSRFFEDKNKGQVYARANKRMREARAEELGR